MWDFSFYLDKTDMFPAKVNIAKLKVGDVTGTEPKPQRNQQYCVIPLAKRCGGVYGIKQRTGFLPRIGCRYNLLLANTRY
jgi:hypothetical protein